MTITLPLPQKELSQNARVHWAVRHLATKNARAMAAMMGRLSRTRFTERVRIQAVFYYKTKRRRDGPNLTGLCKAYIDGLVDAGVIPDDSTEWVEWMDPQVKIHVLNPRLELRIEPLEQEHAA